MKIQDFLHHKFECPFKFTDVLVLESLRPGDIRTGEKLYEDLLVPLSIELGLHDPEYLKLSSISEFRVRLQALEDEAKSGRIPILVLEMHGSEHGIEFASEEILTWEELSHFLRPINLATKNNLFLYANYCYGYETILSIESIEEPAAFWGLYGPLPAIETAKAEHNKVFFEELLRTRKVGNALKKIESICPSIFKFTTAELLFLKSYASYIHNSCKNERLAERVKYLIRHNPNKAKTKVNKFRQKQEIIKFINSHKTYDKYKNQFLMIDRYPEIATRFEFKKEHAIQLANKYY